MFGRPRRIGTAVGALFSRRYKKLQMRKETEIFADLANLYSSPGYVHALAHLCFRDNMITYSGEMKPEDMRNLFSESRLIRTETSTLIGLLIKQDIDFTLPAPAVIQQYINKSDALLKELHDSMSGVAFAH